MLAASDPRPDAHLNTVASDSNPEVVLSDGGLYLTIKLVGDFLCALVLLILTAPLVLLAMLLIKFTSRGPALYTQTRLGRHGKPFTIYKLRTLSQDSENLTGARWCVPGDSRITRLGRWLRKTHIDELPQLWNVLRGEMSLIGPRPERPEFVPQLEQAIPHYRDRLLVRPGLTGLAQVQLPPDTDLASVRIKLAYDLHYVQKVNPWLDFRIAWATLFKMAGMPFRMLRSAFAFPTREAIESLHKRLIVATGGQMDASAKPGSAHDSGTLRVVG